MGLIKGTLFLFYSVVVVGSFLLEQDWTLLTTVNRSCPRFIYADIGNDGLADQLERLAVGLAPAYINRLHGLTLIVDDMFGRKSIHYKGGYHHTLHNILGLPSNLSTYTTVRRSYKPKEVNILYSFSLSKNYVSLFPCNTLHITDVYDSCKGVWCPFLYSEEIQTHVKPLLRKTFQSSQSLCLNKIESPLNSSALNIVWHFRTGDVCPHCNDTSYYNRIHSFISSALALSPPSKRPIAAQNLIIHSAGSEQLARRVFQAIPSTVFYSNHSVSRLTCIFLNADILVASGSTFPSMVTWFAPLFRPILFEDYRHSARELKAKILHTTAAADSIRMREGVVDPERSPQTVYDKLVANGVILRVTGH